MTARKRPSGKGESKYLETPCPTCGAQDRILNGIWCANVRKAMGESQRQFALRLGFAPSYISDIEHNRRNCPHEVREAYERLAVAR